MFQPDPLPLAFGPGRFQTLTETQALLLRHEPGAANGRVPVDALLETASVAVLIACPVTGPIADPVPITIPVRLVITYSRRPDAVPILVHLAITAAAAERTRTTGSRTATTRGGHGHGTCEQQCCRTCTDALHGLHLIVLHGTILLLLVEDTATADAGN